MYADQHNLDMLQWSLALTGLAFVAAFGCICGSFINVLVYRLPLGLNIVTPPSACPHCDTRLSWRENLPVIGWLALAGRCRFCKTRISPQYPIVEAFTGLLFALIYILWFMDPSPLSLIGVSPAPWRADFALEGLRRAWPMLLVVYALMGALIASTLIDARTFTIPLALPWFATAVAFIVHPLHALWIQNTAGRLIFVPFTWNIPVPPDGAVLGATLGGALGIALSVLMLWTRVLQRSFSDYPEWEACALAQQQAATPATPSVQDPATSTAHAPSESTRPDSTTPPTLRPQLTRALFLTGPAVALMLLGAAMGMSQGLALPFMTIGAAGGLLAGLVLRRLVPDAQHSSARSGEPDATAEPLWTQYPHARREMLKEIAYLAPCLALAALGWWLCRAPGPWGHAAYDAPLWLRALAGSLLGYLVGGGLVWAFRIGGSLALGKEAMGLGDVHLMAAVGAAMGWIDPTLAFFIAPFLGITWACLGAMFRQVFHTAGTALPYGPHLAGATAFVVVLKPVVELVLSIVFGRNVNIP